MPLLVMSFLFQHGGEGHAPSLSHLCLIFDASERGMPLLIVFLLFRRDKEGHPLLIVLFPFQHGKEGNAPSPSCLCLIFDVSGEGYAPPHCVFAILTQ